MTTRDDDRGRSALASVRGIADRILNVLLRFSVPDRRLRFLRGRTALRDPLADEVAAIDGSSDQSIQTCGVKYGPFACLRQGPGRLRVDSVSTFPEQLLLRWQRSLTIDAASWRDLQRRSALCIIPWPACWTRNQTLKTLFCVRNSVRELSSWRD